MQVSPSDLGETEQNLDVEDGQLSNKPESRSQEGWQSGLYDQLTRISLPAPHSDTTDFSRVVTQLRPKRIVENHTSRQRATVV